MTGTKRKWSVLLVALLLVALALAAAACGEETTTTESPASSPVAGGTLNYPISAEPGGITSWTVYESEGWQVVHNTQEGLVKYVLQEDGSMKPTPNIAESYESSDGKVWTIKIKQGVTFAPPVSREVTAQDFIDSWNFNTDPDLGDNYTCYILAPIEGTDDSGYRTGATLTGVKKIDDYTIEVTLKYPFFDFPVTLGHPVSYVQPVEYIKQIGAKKYREKPVGTGPYMVQKWTHNQSVALVKNPSWWQASAENGPFLDAVAMKVYLNTNTEWLDFQKGTIDWTDIPPGQVNAAENNAKVKDGTWSAKKWPNLGFYYTNINHKSTLLGGADKLPLRQALAYSADTANIINVINEGVSLPANGLVPVGIPGSDLSTLPYPYDLAKAKELVAQIGTVPELSYMFNTDLGHQKIAEALQAGWKQAGINVKLSNLEWNTFNKFQRTGAPESQLSRSGWLADYPSMDNFLYPLYQSKQQGLNGYSFWNNAEFDQLLQQARATADETQRLNLYAQAEKIALDDVCVIPIYFYREFRVWNSSRMQGMVYDPMSQMDFWKVWVNQ